jgi:hypothetical protein
MHLLTGPEIEKIVEFYTKQKSVDDICSSYEDMDDLPEDTGRLHERIRNELRELDTAQQEAISEIEQHIND